MRISTRSWPACDWTSEAYLAACWAAAMWSILSLIPVSFVKRWPISASFLSMSGAKLFQQRYEISRCCPRAGLAGRSEEHTSELQSLAYLVCRLLLEKKKKTNFAIRYPQNPLELTTRSL